MDYPSYLAGVKTRDEGWDGAARQPRGLGRDRGTGERDGSGKGATRAKRTKRFPGGEAPVGQRHRVAGDPVGYKHGMKGQGDGAGKGV